MGRLSSVGSVLLASGLIGTLVFAATLLYCAERAGWEAGLVKGWAPALAMALVAMIACLAAAAALALRSARRPPPRAEALRSETSGASGWGTRART